MAIAEGGMTGYNPAWSKAMEIIGWGFHKTECSAAPPRCC